MRRLAAYAAYIVGQAVAFTAVLNHVWGAAAWTGVGSGMSLIAIRDLVETETDR